MFEIEINNVLCTKSTVVPTIHLGNNNFLIIDELRQCERRQTKVVGCIVLYRHLIF